MLQGSPAEGVLQVGDLIQAVDGKPAQTATDVVEMVRQRDVGEAVRLRILRDGQEQIVSVGTRNSPQEPGQPSVPSVGVAICTRNFDVQLPFPVQIDTDTVGGASGGLMFALGILDAVTDEILPRGHLVAGTGTISTDGRVGPIGGAAQKVAAAEQEGARVFLVPQQNYNEARSAARSVEVVAVQRFEDAVAALGRLQPTAGASPDPPEPCR